MKPIPMEVHVGLLETREDVERLIRRLCLDAAEPQYAAEVERREMQARLGRHPSSPFGLRPNVKIQKMKGVRP